MASGVRPGGRRPRTPKALADFIEKGATAVMDKAPSPAELMDNEPPAPVHLPLPEPVSTPLYTGPEQDPWEILRHNLPPEAIAALEQVTGKKDPGPGNAPWYECWDVNEGRPTGHPPFQGFVKPGQHVYCPYVDDVRGTCGRKTVRPLENYKPA
jgi:hypothetical protein